MTTTQEQEEYDSRRLRDLYEQKREATELLRSIDAELETEQTESVFTAPPVLLSRLGTTDPPPLDEVLPGLPAGKVGVLSGRGGRGKSLLLLRFMLSVAGADYRTMGLNAEAVAPDWELIQPPRRAVYLSLEDDISEVHRRAKRLHDYLKYDLKRSEAEWEQASSRVEIYPFSARLTTPLLEENHFPAFSDQYLKGAGLIVVDTLRLAHDKEENSSSEMAQLFRQCALLAEQTGAAVLLATHENKGGGEGSDAVRGSTAIVDNARWLARLRPPSKEEIAKYSIAEDAQIVVLEVPKLNYRRPPAPLFLSLEGGVAHPVNLTSRVSTALAFSAGDPF